MTLAHKFTYYILPYLFQFEGYPHINMRFQPEINLMLGLHYVLKIVLCGAAGVLLLRWVLHAVNLLSHARET